MIPFKLPTIGPCNEDEAEKFTELFEIMKTISSAVGWAVSMGRFLQEKHQFEGRLLTEVKSRLPGVEPRLCIAYTTLVYCVSKVSV